MVYSLDVFYRGIYYFYNDVFSSLIMENKVNKFKYMDNGLIWHIYEQIIIVIIFYCFHKSNFPNQIQS